MPIASNVTSRRRCEPGYWLILNSEVPAAFFPATVGNSYRISFGVKVNLAKDFLFSQASVEIGNRNAASSGKMPERSHFIVLVLK
jgi:hypothetical protein